MEQSSHPILLLIFERYSQLFFLNWIIIIYFDIDPVS